MRIGSLFSGYGGLEAGVLDVLGGSVAWHAEVDPAASRVLAHHWPEVPNLGDVTAVDWTSVDPVDVLVGGFPCQDVSSAGKRAGMRPDTRSGLWAHFANAIDQLRPELVVIENVRGLLSADANHPAHSDVAPCDWCLADAGRPPLRALGAVLGDLADLGFDARWQGLRAADVGAPHGRFRVFVVAHPADADPVGRGRPGGAPGPVGGPIRGAAAARPRPDAAADTVGGGWQRGRPTQLRRASVDVAGHRLTPADANSDALRQQPVPLTGGGCEALTRHPGAAAAADAPGDGSQGGHEQPDGGPTPRGGAGDPRRGGADAVAWGPYRPAIRRWERRLGRPAPAPTEVGERGGRRLSPAFVEWLMGLAPGHVTAVPGVSRREQLRILGNGVVPQQAAAALTGLLGL